MHMTIRGLCLPSSTSTCITTSACIHAHACTQSCMLACMCMQVCMHACMHARSCMDVSQSQASIVDRPCGSSIVSNASRLFLFFLMVSGSFKPLSCSIMCYYVILIIILISVIIVITKITTYQRRQSISPIVSSSSRPTIAPTA